MLKQGLWNSENETADSADFFFRHFLYIFNDLFQPETNFIQVLRFVKNFFLWIVEYALYNGNAM